MAREKSRNIIRSPEVRDQVYKLKHKEYARD